MQQQLWIAPVTAAGLLLSGAAYGQSSVADYPARPVRVIVSFAPGGATDVVARLVAQKVSESMGRSFVVENRAGAGGVTGDLAVARAAPDGYTLLGTSSTYAINPAMIAKLPFDPIKDLTPISLIAQAPFLLVVHPSVPAKNVKDLIALAKAKPGTLDYASAGAAIHLAISLFSGMSGVKMMHIPYKGTGPALIDLLAGRVQLTLGNIVSTGPYVTSGRLRALGVTSAKRSSAMPQLPTISESGVPGYDVASWYGWMAPAGTPPIIINRLNAEIVKIVKARDMTERLLGDGADPVGSTAEQFAQYLAAEIARWQKAVKESGITPE